MNHLLEFTSRKQTGGSQTHNLLSHESNILTITLQGHNSNKCAEIYVNMYAKFQQLHKTNHIFLCVQRQHCQTSEPSLVLLKFQMTLPLSQHGSSVEIHDLYTAHPYKYVFRYLYFTAMLLNKIHSRMTVKIILQH